MMDFRLNERQKRFAEENHKVLEDFLRYRGLPQEEFYDVVVFRFLRAVQHGNSQLCTIYIYDDELKEWIGKTDGAGDTDIESIKGGLSDAFKRAAVKWNIGRYLYKFKPVWVTAEKKGKNTFLISEPDKAKLEKQYYATVEKLFGKQKPKPQEEKKPAEPKPQS